MAAYRSLPTRERELKHVHPDPTRWCDCRSLHGSVN